SNHQFILYNPTSIYEPQCYFLYCGSMAVKHLHVISGTEVANCFMRDEACYLFTVRRSQKFYAVFLLADPALRNEVYPHVLSPSLTNGAEPILSGMLLYCAKKQNAI